MGQEGSSNLKLGKWFGISSLSLAWKGRERMGIAWLVALIFGYYSRVTPHPSGIILCLLGATLRFWSSGFLRKDTHPAVGGPYGWVRNPLYLGTYIMALGTSIAIQNLWIFAGMSLVFFLVYDSVIRFEEKKLVQIFGPNFLSYCAKVPRFFPQLWLFHAKISPEQASQINPDPKALEFSWELAIQNKAYEAFLSSFALIGYISLMQYLWNLKLN